MKKAKNLVDKIEKFSRKSETKETYAECVRKTLDRAFHDTGKDSITIDTFERAPYVLQGILRLAA